MNKNNFGEIKILCDLMEQWYIEVLLCIFKVWNLIGIWWIFLIFVNYMCFQFYLALCYVEGLSKMYTFTSPLYLILLKFQLSLWTQEHSLNSNHMQPVFLVTFYMHVQYIVKLDRKIYNLYVSLLHRNLIVFDLETIQLIFKMTRLKPALFNVFDNVHLVMVTAQISIQVNEILRKKYSIIVINRFLGSFPFYISLNKF